MSTINKYLDQELRERAARMADGDKFPTEAELCSEFSVSRMTVNKVLRDITRDGLLVRTPRRGTYVRKPKPVNTVDWLNDGYFGNSIFDMMPRTLRLNIDEYRYGMVRPMWDDMLNGFKAKYPQIKLEVTTEPEAGAEADIIWASTRRDQRTLSIEAFSDSPEAVAAIRRECRIEDYFPVSWLDLRRSGRAGCPLALSTSLYVWNNRLLGKYCPRPNGKIPERLVGLLLEQGGWESPDFPPVASYVFCPLLLIQWASEGILHYDRQKGITGKDNPRILEYLDFNKAMLAKSVEANGGEPLNNMQDIVRLFAEGKFLALNTFSPTLKRFSPELLRDFSVSTALVGNSVPVIPVYLGIGPNCRDIRSAAQAIAYLCGPEGQQIAASHKNNIPACKEAARSEAFLQPGPANMTEVLDILEQASDVIDPQCFFADNAGYSEMLSRYIIGDIDLSDLTHFEPK